MLGGAGETNRFFFWGGFGTVKKRRWPQRPGFVRRWLGWRSADALLFACLPPNLTRLLPSSSSPPSLRVTGTQSAQDLVRRRRLNKLCLKYNPQVYDLLQIPQLMVCVCPRLVGGFLPTHESGRHQIICGAPFCLYPTPPPPFPQRLQDTLVRRSAYDEALQLEAFVSTLEGRLGSDVDIVGDIVAAVAASMGLMLSRLQASLRTNIELPTCLRVVSYLRRSRRCVCGCARVRACVHTCSSEYLVWRRRV